MKETIAYECEFCGKIYKNLASCKSHEYKCYFNPRTRSCASCALNRYEEQSVSEGVTRMTRICLMSVPVEVEGLKTKCRLYQEKMHVANSEILEPMIDQ